MGIENRMKKEAPTTEVTNEVIIHAVSDPYPRLHYVVGTADGAPMWVSTFLAWFLPGRVFDKLLRAL